VRGQLHGLYVSLAYALLEQFVQFIGLWLGKPTINCFHTLGTWEIPYYALIQFECWYS
jgi:hypothetical protein